MKELKTSRLAARGEQPDWAVLKQPRNVWVGNRMWCESASKPVSIHSERKDWYEALGVRVYSREYARDINGNDVCLVTVVEYRLNGLSK